MSKKLVVPRYLNVDSICRNDEGLINFVLGHTARVRKELVLDEDCLKLIQCFLTPQTPQDVAQSLGKPLDEVESICQELCQARILVETFVMIETFQRYDRHFLFYNLAGADAVSVQQVLAQSRVALIGMGGIGNWVSLGLIGIGLKELRLIDFDCIELTNLTRQILFDEADIGKKKNIIAQQRLQTKNSQTRITAIDLQVSQADELEMFLKDIDFVVLSADRPAKIHDWVDQVCVKYKIPYLNIGYKDANGVVGPLTVPGQTSCYQCFKPAKSSQELQEPLFQETIAHFDSHYQAPSFGPLNALVSAIGVIEVVKHLCGFGQYQSLDQELIVDPFTLQITAIPYSRDPHCWHCGGL